MSNEITTEQLKELLEIQKEFDNRISTLNLEDSKIAFIVEFFEWFNTLETFKNWKAKPGKPLEIQLDELADMLAFGLSIVNQENLDFKKIEGYLSDISRYDRDYLTKDILYYFMDDVSEFGLYGKEALLLPIDIAYNLYSIPQLIAAYKKKMKRNHERQNGTVDAEKGYV